MRGGDDRALVMSPASTTEIIFAKITPLFLMLSVIGIVAMLAIRYVFQVPFHGSALLVFAGCALCMLSGNGLGMFIATLSRTSAPAQLAVFFFQSAAQLALRSFYTD